ncbi:hypothetical protein [Actinoplanes xinjiangensis]|uniref:hypothetical protein n=1 Tax=Actinoplanes xinjiangensis TaxID=512350 RepID=UPI000D6D802D|nr:hypothetical protein [Actinoplanes xinjiangensis]GIF40397.1 hypothetical protein Axi01nite_47080 [Actinoplanes xinjiangensis]
MPDPPAGSRTALEGCGWSAARLGGWYFRSAGEPAETTDGALFEVRPGPVSGRGDWGRPQRIRARAVTAGLAVAAVAAATARHRRAARR